MKRRILAVLLTAALLMTLCVPALAEYRIYPTNEWYREEGKYSTLKKGSSGYRVENLQWRLVELGYMDACDVDGVYGNQTKNAVYAFQVNNWLTGPDGIAYPYTQYKLYDKFARPTWGFTMDVPVDEYSSSFDVERVERRLCDTGYLPDRYVDGVFDANTMAVIMMFEIVNGLYPEDGVADEEMLRLLFSYNMESCPEDIKPEY